MNWRRDAAICSVICFRNINPSDCSSRRPELRRGRLPAAAQEEPCSKNDQDDADHLHQRKCAPGKDRPAGVVAEKFNGDACDPVEDRVGAEDFAGEPPPLREPQKENENYELARGLVELRRMQRNTERGSGQVLRDRIGKRDAPGNTRRLPVAASGGKAAQASDGMAQGARWRIEVQDRQRVQLVPPGINDADQRSAQECAVKNSAGKQRAEAEDFTRVVRVVLPLSEDEPHFCAGKCGENGVDTNGPNLFRVESQLRRPPPPQPQSGEHRYGNQRAVGVQRKRSPMKQYWVHGRSRARSSLPAFWFTRRSSRP